MSQTVWVKKKKKEEVLLAFKIQRLEDCIKSTKEDRLQKPGAIQTTQSSTEQK